jgi:hypothetical protein
MAGLPLPAPPSAMGQLDGLLLVRLPFADDRRKLAFRGFNDTSKPHVSRLVEHCGWGPAARRGCSW